MTAARLFAFLLPAALATSACEIGIAADGVEGSFQRDLMVSGPAELNVSSGSGDIVVRTGPAGTVRVHARVRAHSGAWVSFNGEGARERIRRIEQDPPIEQSGNRIEVGPRRWNDGWNGISISYEITVPASTRLQARSGSGDLEVSEVAGPVEMSTGSGNIRVGRVNSDVAARTGSGDIDLAGAGSARASTGSGNITAMGIRGDLEVRTGSGDLTLGQSGKGRVDISTGSGDIDLIGASGPLHARAGSGDIQVEGTPIGDWDLNASSGDVRVRLPRAGGFDLDLRSSSGRIDTSIPITVSGRQSRREIRGQVRGGGPLVHISTSSGAIIVQ
jgi:DUF4097 and DUF4098 domain-containing protein YvlB